MSHKTKEARREYQRKWREQNKEKDRERSRRFYAQHKEERRLQAKIYRNTNRDKFREQVRNSHHIRRFKLRNEVINLLGSKCANCGYSSNIHALQIDHINGKGREDRRQFKGSQERFYNYVIEYIKQGQNNKYQILCANCNAIKRIENKEHRER